MSVPRFFKRVHAAVGRHLAVDPSKLATRLEGVEIAVRCAPRTDQSADWISELLINQLARLYPKLCIHGDEEQVLVLTQLARAINPDISLVSDPAPGSVSLTTCGVGRPGELVVAANGWVASLGFTDMAPARSAPNPFSAGAAAALAASAVFRHVLLRTDGAWSPTVLDVLAYDATGSESIGELGTVDLGEAIIAGVGAVGNAALWALSRHPQLTGHAWVIDPETVDLSNLQRYVLAADKDVGRAKVDLAREVLSNTGLSLTTERASLEAAEIPQRIDTVLVTVDNIRARRVAQALLPGLVVNGWTSETGLGASWHDFREGQACLACLYHPSGPGPSQTDLVARALGLAPDRAALLWITPERMSARDVKTIADQLGAKEADLKDWIGRALQDAYTSLICGSAPVALDGQGALETVPLAHQSVLAGVLAAAEVVKRRDPILRGLLPDPNLMAWHDVTRSPPARWLQRRTQAAGCFCSDEDYRSVHGGNWNHLV